MSFDEFCRTTNPMPASTKTKRTVMYGSVQGQFDSGQRQNVARVDNGRLRVHWFVWKIKGCVRSEFTLWQSESCSVRCWGDDVGLRFALWRCDKAPYVAFWLRGRLRPESLRRSFQVMFTNMDYHIECHDGLQRRSNDVQRVTTTWQIHDFRLCPSPVWYNGGVTFYVSSNVSRSYERTTQP